MVSGTRKENAKKVDKETMHKMFGEVWGMVNALRKTKFSDEGWAACIAKSSGIGKSYGDPVAKKITLAAIDEAEAIDNMGSQEEAMKEYKLAYGIFMDAWELAQSYFENPELFLANGIDEVRAFTCKYGGKKFASQLASAIYGYACSEAYEPGSFMGDAAKFYEKYSGGITEGNYSEANREAEEIIGQHPEFTCQMASLLSSLQKKSAAETSLQAA